MSSVGTISPGGWWKRCDRRTSLLMRSGRRRQSRGRMCPPLSNRRPRYIKQGGLQWESAMSHGERAPRRRSLVEAGTVLPYSRLMEIIDDDDDDDTWTHHHACFPLPSDGDMARWRGTRNDDPSTKSIPPSSRTVLLPPTPPLGPLLPPSSFPPSLSFSLYLSLLPHILFVQLTSLIFIIPISGLRNCTSVGKPSISSTSSGSHFIRTHVVLATFLPSRHPHFP